MTTEFPSQTEVTLGPQGQRDRGISDDSLAGSGREESKWLSCVLGHCPASSEGTGGQDRRQLQIPPPALRFQPGFPACASDGSRATHLETGHHLGPGPWLQPRLGGVSPEGSPQDRVGVTPGSCQGRVLSPCLCRTPRLPAARPRQTQVLQNPLGAAPYQPHLTEEDTEAQAGGGICRPAQFRPEQRGLRPGPDHCTALPPRC